MFRITFVFLFAFALILSVAGAAGAQQTTIEVVVIQDMVPEASAEVHTSFRGEFQQSELSQSELSAKRKSGAPVLAGLVALILMTATRILLRVRLAPGVSGFTT